MQQPMASKDAACISVLMKAPAAEHDGSLMIQQRLCSVTGAHIVLARTHCMVKYSFLISTLF